MGLKKLLIDSGENFRPRDLDYGDNAPLTTKALPGVEENPEGAGRELIDDLTSGIIPGGALTAGERIITDTKRIGKFLLTGDGIRFMANEAIGQRMNPQSLISPTNRTRLPINLMAQIVSGPSGLHFRRDGLLDRDIESNFNYDAHRYEPNPEEEEGGFLSKIGSAIAGATQGKKYETEIRGILNSGEGLKGGPSVDPKYADYKYAELNYGGDITPNPKTLTSLYRNFVLEPDTSIIKEYSGGAGSVFGIGNTQIKRYEKIATPNEDNITQQINKVKTRGGALSQYKTGDPNLNPSPDGTYTYNSPTVDQINVADVFKRVNLSEESEDAENLKDFIKFKIALVDTSNPLNDEVLLFRAFLEGMNDSYTGNWNAYTYNGRAEQFHTYSGFDRNINFNFKVAPQSMIELKPLYRKLNYLVSSTAPEYVNRRMRGRYVRLTIGDWCYEVPGFFPSIGLSWTSNYPWEMNPDNDNALSQHPLILDVNCIFKPIHDFTPESKIDKPFIIRTGNMIKPFSTFPNAPSPIVPIPPTTISNNIPTPELQQSAQTNLNNAVTGQTENIQFARIEGPSTRGGNDGLTIDFGNVNKLPISDGNPNSINRLLSNLSNQISTQLTDDQLVAKSLQNLEQRNVNAVVNAGRPRF
tara:strand:- start:6969 stop:8888 length:1920 start_codon:yes stop_codon:yes gene_type:complete